MFTIHFPQASKSIIKNNSGIEFTGIFQETDRTRLAEYQVNTWSKGLYAKQISNVSSKTENSILISLQIWRIKSDLVEHLQIPEKIINKIKTFGDYWFPVVQICAQDPRAMDLLEHNPILLALIIHKLFNKDENLVDLNNILDKKQTEILKLLGAKGLSSEIKLLRKLAPINSKKIKVDDYFQILRNKNIFQFFHYYLENNYQFLLEHFELFVANLQNIDKFSMAKLVMFRADKIFDKNDLIVKTWYASWDSRSIIVKESQQEYILSNFFGLLNDHLNNGKANDLEDQVLDSLANAASVHAIQDHHNYLNDSLYKKSLDKKWSDSQTVLEKGGIDFPQPPLQGNDDIIPIQCSYDLIAEGQWMRHCVGGYTNYILLKSIYVYRVLQPERATLSLDFYNKDVTISDFRKRRNQMIREDTFELCSDWLKSSGFHLLTEYKELIKLRYRP